MAPAMSCYLCLFSYIIKLVCLHIAFPADFIYRPVADITEIGAILTGIFHGDEVSDLASVWGGKNNICAESEASYIGAIY